MALPRLLNVGYVHARGLLVANCDRAAWAGERAAAEAAADLEAFDRTMNGGAAPGGGEPDRETWGTGPVAEAGQNALLAITSGG